MPGDRPDRGTGPPRRPGDRGRLDRAIEAALPLRLVLDWSGVTFMDSSGIAVVMRVRQRMRDLGGAVTLRGVRPQARKVLDAAGMDRFVTVE